MTNKTRLNLLGIPVTSCFEPLKADSRDRTDSGREALVVNFWLLFSASDLCRMNLPRTFETTVTKCLMDGREKGKRGKYK